MVRSSVWQWSLCFALVLSAASVRAADDGQAQALLDKATDIKLSAENLADLNQVVELCQQAIKDGGLDEGNTKFAQGLLASTLSQRAEMVCMDLFDRPVTPNRARRLIQMALSDLEQTLQLDPEQGSSQFLLGRLYAQLGQPEKALPALNAAIRLAADDPAAQAKALMIRANVQPDAATRQADFDAAVQLTPKDPNVLRFRGMYYLTQNDLDAAIRDLNAAIEIDPTDADTYEARGIAYSLGKKYDEAMESLNKALELEPDAASSLVQRGRVRAIKGDFPGALQDVDRALTLQPGSVQALQLHASLLGSTGKFEQALADLALLRRAMPDNPDILSQMAVLYQASKQPEKALATYDHWLSTDADSAAALRGRADVYLSMGKQTEAIADYEKALTLEPKNSGVLNNLAWVLATSPTESLRDGKRAIELAKLACEVTEYQQAHIVSTLAAGYAETGDFDNAVTWSKKAVELGTEQLKPQLGKELESYQAKKPWREETPPTDFIPEQTAKPDKGAAAPSNDDTARNKRS